MVTILAYVYLLENKAYGQLDSLVQPSFPKDFLPQIPGKDSTSKADSSNFYDKVRKFTGLQGTIGFDYIFRSNSYYGQQVQEHVFRTNINPSLSIAGLPFSTNINLTTEGKQIGYNLNNFSFSFDHERYKQELIRKTKEKAKADFNARDSLRNYFEKQLNADHLLDSLKQEKERLLALPELPGLKTGDASLAFSDTVSPKVKDSLMALQHKLNQQKERLEEIENTLAYLQKEKDRYEKLKRSGFFDRRLKYDEAQLQKDPGLLRSHHTLSRLDAWLMSVKTIEVGSIMPSYSPLYFQGMRLNGLNTELQHRNHYIALIGGLAGRKANFNVFEPVDFSNFTYGARWGLGTSEGSNFRLSYLQNKETSRNTNNDITSFDYLNPRENKVYHISTQLHLGKQWYVRGEVASSQSKELMLRDYRQVKEQVTSQYIIPNRFDLNAPNIAYNTELEGNLERTNTQVLLSHGKTGPSYFTAGNPYLRTDIAQTKLTLQQSLLRNIFRLKVQLSDSRDNLQGFKSYTTQIRTIQSTLGFRYKKFPILSIFQLYTLQCSKGNNYFNGFANSVQVYGMNVTKNWVLSKKYLLLQSVVYQYNSFSSDVSSDYYNTSVNVLHSLVTGKFTFNLSDAMNMKQAFLQNHTHSIDAVWNTGNKMGMNLMVGAAYSNDYFFGSKITALTGVQGQYKSYGLRMQSGYNIYAGGNAAGIFNRQLTVNLSLTRIL